MAVRWVVDADHPEGHAVEMTEAEEEQLEADQAAAAKAEAAEAACEQNAATIRQAIETQMGRIRTARTAISNGNLFQSLTANERNVIDGLLQDDLYVGRLLLNQLDATD